MTASPPGGAAPELHAHAWSAMRFEFREDRPWVVESCARCGKERRYRAFERNWDPGPGETGARAVDGGGVVSPRGPAGPGDSAP